jgi:hypothetical protein
MGISNQLDATPRRKLVTPLSVILFVFGLCVFVPATLILFFIAYPTFASPGPQADVRIPVFATFVILVLMTFLGRAGRAFAAGFGSGLVALVFGTVLQRYQNLPLPSEFLSLGEFAQVWISPEGTKLRDAKLAVRVEEAGKRSAARARQRWLDLMRTRGMDEALGTRTALVATNCAMGYRTQNGEFPAASGTTLHTAQCDSWLSEISTDDEAWRLAYYPVQADGRVTGFRIALAPDTVLGLDGPIIESNDAGLVTMRAKPGAPAYIRGSPLPAVVNWVVPCVWAIVTAYQLKAHQVYTLEDLVGRAKNICNADPLSSIDEDPDPKMRYNANAYRIIVSAPGFQKYNTTSVYDLLYVPRGKKQGDGYDLYVSPMNYAYSGVRSYLVAADKSIHVTTERRRATLSDPLALPCESNLKVPCFGAR